MSQSKSPSISRRTAFVGAGAVGAAAAAAALLPRTPAPAATPSAKVAEKADQPAGYRESEHVLQYYRTTRV